LRLAKKIFELSAQADEKLLEGSLELTIDGTLHIVRPGIVAIVPPNVLHSARALTDGRAIVVDYPLRADFR
jgi:quercetin dioxygenase-like cupin family protein